MSHNGRNRKVTEIAEASDRSQNWWRIHIMWSTDRSRSLAHHLRVETTRGSESTDREHFWVINGRSLLIFTTPTKNEFNVKIYAFICHSSFQTNISSRQLLLNRLDTVSSVPFTPITKMKISALQTLFFKLEIYRSNHPPFTSFCNLVKWDLES